MAFGRDTFLVLCPVLVVCSAPTAPYSTDTPKKSRPRRGGCEEGGVAIAESQNRRIAESQNRRIAEPQNPRIPESQNHRIGPQYSVEKIVAFMQPCRHQIQQGVFRYDLVPTYLTEKRKEIPPVQLDRIVTIDVVV